MPSGPDDNPALARVRRLVQALACKLAAGCVETHVSWVLLTAESAYKIKKPLTLPFLDYGTLAARRQACEDELRLSRRYAPSIYRAVLPIGGSEDDPLLGGEPPIEFALAMHRFPQEALFSHGAALGTLDEGAIDRLAAWLSQCHAQAPIASADAPPQPVPQRLDAALALLDAARGALGEHDAAQLERWLRRESALLGRLWRRRRDAGRVRDCHGDLHLDNLLWLDGEVAAFDAIEFDPALRWIDVLDDAAFVVMDLATAGRRDLAFRFLCAWLDAGGDHDGLPALRYACVDRALVRAMAASRRDDPALARRYAAQALQWTQPAAPWLLITFGLPGAGKTWSSQQLLQRHGAIRLRSDVERKRLFGLAMLASSRRAGQDIYGAAATAKAYATLFAKARGALAAGWPVVIDAAFLKADERAQAKGLARELGVPFGIVECVAEPDVLAARLAARRGDASEADAAVLQRLAQAVEPLDASERLVAKTPAQALDAHW